MKTAPEYGSHPNKDLYENRDLYAREPLPTDMILTVHDESELLTDADERYADTPIGALAGLLGQYKKDLLFEHDRQSRRELKDQIAALEAELEHRTQIEHDRLIQLVLKQEVSPEFTAARRQADAHWSKTVKRKAA